MRNVRNKRFIATALVPLTLSLSIFMGASGGGGGGGDDSNESESGNAGEYTGITIAIDEEFSDYNIFDITEPSIADYWVYTMIYDRLIDLDEQGNFVPSLATDWRLIPDSEDSGPNLPIIDPTELFDYSQEFNINDVPGWSSLLLEMEGINSSEDLEFLSGRGRLIIEFDLRANVTYQNGITFDSGALFFFIQCVQSLPTDTLLYKQWECVENIKIIDSDRVQMTLSFANDTKGYMDFMYSLTTPIASIVDPGTFCGTGAYGIVGEYDGNEFYSQDYLTLHRYDDWFGGVAPEEYIRFKYDPVGALDGTYDMMVGNDISDIESLPRQIDVAGNPIVLSFNRYYGEFVNSEKRKTLLNQWQTLDLFNTNSYSLLDASNDFWATFKPSYTILTPIFPTAKPVLLVEENTCSANIVNMLSETLGQYFDDLPIDVIYASPDDYQMRIDSDDYDMVIREIELSEINSNYIALNTDINKFIIGSTVNPIDQNLRTLNNSIDNWRRAADQKTFGVVQAVSQHLFTGLALGVNFGWTSKTVAYGDNISGFNAPSGFSSASDCSRLDFRFLDKQA